MKPPSSVLEKIKKLLSLANSSNENEAKSAMNKANELLVRYNLDLQQVEDHQRSYVESSSMFAATRIQSYQKYIFSILTEFFFVYCSIKCEDDGMSSGEYGDPRPKYKRHVQFMGTKENCEIASYIFVFLNDAYPKLWSSYKKANGLDGEHRLAYYKGLTIGIERQLDEQRWRIQNETGLVLVEDPALKAFRDKLVRGSYNGVSKQETDPHIVADGIRDGLNVTLRKPIASEQNQSDTKLLS